jgi:hypothetical protein
MFYVLNFCAEILPILTNDLACTDLGANDTSFHVIGVVRHEMQIMSCIGRLTVHFHGQIRIPLHDKDIQVKISKISTLTVNFMADLRLLRW